MYRNLISIMVVSFFLIIALGSAGKPAPTTEELQSANYGPYPSNYEEIIKNYYSQILFDPYSAHFRFLQPKKVGWSDGGRHYFGYAVCGGINAKNRFGGYVGEQAFFVIINSDQVILQYTKSLAVNACNQFY